MHESHFSADALDLLADEHVYVFFLKCANSENDELNDKRPNLTVTTSCYAHAVADWLNRNPGVPYNPAFFNQDIVQAWDSFAAQSGPSICCAAARVGLYLLDRNAVNFQCKGDRPAQVHAGEQADDGADDFAVAVQPEVSEGFKYSLLQARVKLPGSKNPEIASLFIRSAAVNFFQTSTVTSTHEIVMALGDQKRARNKLSDDAIDHDGEPTTLRNPSTKSGLFACADVRAECRRVEEARASKQQEKDEAARRTEARRVDNRRRAEAKGLWFLKQYDARAVGADLASPDDHFRGQAALLTDVISFLDLDTSGSKADKIFRLRNYLLKRPEFLAISLTIPSSPSRLPPAGLPVLGV